MEKDAVKIVITGHVDHGKSTLIGRLLLETNSLPKGQLREIRRISKELGKDTELAYLADQLKEERELNITIDTTQIFFKTRKKNFVVIDTPGHAQFSKNMITGASSAQAALFVVDVSEGIMGQLRRQAFIVNILGIDKVIVAFNKMDLIDYEEKRLVHLRDDLFKFLKNLHIKPLFAVPVSAREGVNISKRSRKLSWYKGPTLVEALESLEISAQDAKRPLRFPIQDVYKIGGERIIAGRVASGVIEQGNEVVILPSLKKARISSIRIFGGLNKKNARRGESIGLTLHGHVQAERGGVIAQIDNPPALADRFKGIIFWMLDEPLRINKTMSLQCATQKVECVIERIEKRIELSTLHTIQIDADELIQGEAGIVRVKTKEPLVAEKFDFIEELGRFVLEQGNRICAGGIITEKDLT